MTLVYIVEDEDSIRDLVLYALRTSGFTGQGFESSKELFPALQTKIPDLILLDIMLPHMDGLSVLKSIRENTQTREIPVIMITAKGDEYDRVRGLDLGADDYVTKPFSVLELLSRIRAVLRRSTTKQSADEVLFYENISLDPVRHSVKVDSQSVELTLKEFETLQIMMENPGIVFSRSRLLSAVWGMDFDGGTRTVDMHIKTLRRKLGTAREAIQTVRGIGYRVGGD